MRSISMALVLAVLFCVLPLGGWAAPQAGGPAAAEEAKKGWSPEIRASLGFEDEKYWSGGTVVTSPTQTGKAMRWDKHVKNSSLGCRLLPTDLSAFNIMSFWLHSGAANDATFMIIFESRRDEKEFSYFSHQVKVDWTGWKRVEVPFRAFGQARTPAGWNKIDSLRLTASGWNQSPSDESVWVLDDMDFGFTDKVYMPAARYKKYLDAPAKDAFAAKLRPGHPRLMLLDEDIARIAAFVKDDARGKVWYANTKKQAEQYYGKPVQTHRLPDGKRLLSISRDVLNRMYYWGFMYRMEKDRKWLDRAWQEMAAVVAFKDWNPSHYLDTAEMMHAMAIGYDWFYNDLTDAQRKTIREGLWQLGLRLSYASYMGLPAEGGQGWRQVTNNWNFVCNGGTALAAMALLDEMPEQCGEILHQSYQYIQIPIGHFEPDGAWWEGMGYWGYSMHYFLSYLRGLETAFGTDFGFVQALQGTGFSKAGDFPVYLVSPEGEIFNFADSGGGTGVFRHWGLFYLASRFRNPLYLDFQERKAKGEVYDILFYEPFESKLAVQDVALDKYFRETEVATMRGSWMDGNATFAGVKCGKNGIAHAHQDLGSFIFYGLGEKWALDLGTEGQTYQRHKHGIPSHDFYRIREEGHNTLVFDPDAKVCQDTKGESTILRFESSADDVFAVADLTKAYTRYVTSLKRGYRLLDQRRAFLVQDEIAAKKAGEIWWFSHSGPGVECTLTDSGRGATLKRNGKTCHVSLLSPAGATFSVMDAQPLPGSPNPDIQQKNKGIKKLAVHLPDTKDVTITVLYAPVFDFEPTPAIAPEVTALDGWKLGASARPVLSGIEVDGKPLDGFSPAVFGYTVGLAAGVTALPAVKAEAKGGEVKVEAAAGVPGTTRITVTDKAGGAASLYQIRFLPASAVKGTSGEKPQVKSRAAEVKGIKVSASHDDGNVPANVLDGDSESRWSASGTEEWIGFDFGAAKTLSKLGIAWFSGDIRQTRFKIGVSDDEKAWREVFAGQSSGKSAQIETYAFPKPETVRYLRVTCYGNTDNDWNSITEITF